MSIISQNMVCYVKLMSTVRQYMVCHVFKVDANCSTVYGVSYVDVNCSTVYGVPCV